MYVSPVFAFAQSDFLEYMIPIIFGSFLIIDKGLDIKRLVVLYFVLSKVYSREPISLQP